MSEEKKVTRHRMTKEEKKAVLEAKIRDYEKKIEELKAKIVALEAPTVTMSDIRNKIKEAGLTTEEVMKALEKMEQKKQG